MLYYRFRPSVEQSFKELLYSEIYFSTPEECNDPFDCKTFYEFPSDRGKWIKLLELAANGLNIPSESQNVLFSKIVDHLCSLCPLPFDELVVSKILSEYVPVSDNLKPLFQILSIRVNEILRLYKPASRYFVSFSKVKAEPLMWSLYADKHTGFCLIFRSIDGRIRQCQIQNKRQILRNTKKGIAPNMSYTIPDDFEFVDIEYKDEVEPLNGFFNLPKSVSGDITNEQERLELLSQRQKHYTQKHINWQHECEARLILPCPDSWIFGERVEFSQQERLFHYEPSQLVGIIFGARMNEFNKKRVMEILEERRNWGSYSRDYKRIVFDLVVFEARLSSNQRIVEMNATTIIGRNNISATEPDFAERFTSWEEGWGTEMERNKGRRIQVK